MNIHLARFCVTLAHVGIYVGTALVILAIIAWLTLLPVGIGLHFTNTAIGIARLFIILGAIPWASIILFFCRMGIHWVCIKSFEATEHQRAPTEPVTAPTTATVPAVKDQDPIENV